jgi:hypothetical protein
LLVVFIGIGTGVVVGAAAGEAAAALLGGGIVVLVGVFVGLWAYSKAEDYEQAEADYLRKRESGEVESASGPKRMID